MDPSESIFETPLKKTVLTGVLQRGEKEWDVADSLDELAQLTETAGGAVVERCIFKQPRLHAGHFIGKGKVEELAATAEALDADTIIFDDELTPAQGRNLARMTDRRIMDRTQVILDIFARHARTHEGRLQVALAQMEYTLPRLRRMWTHLERQRGGIGVRGGPGEQQMEVDRRRIEERMHRTRRELEDVRNRRAEQRRGRRRHGWALISVVGYTNAGKSTLLNTLTDSDILAYDKLFATLDPTTRQISLPNNQMALMTDTVGFIKKLPHGLVDAFKATLEEVTEADLLMHVIDASHPHVDAQIEAVHRVLDEIGAHDTPVIHVLNKMDREAAAGRARRLERTLKPAVRVSALTGEGMDVLTDALADALKGRNVQMRLRIPLREGKLLSQLRSAANVLQEEYVEGWALIEARVPVHLVGACKPYVEK